MEVADSAMRDPRVDSIALTGGEALLNKKLVLKVLTVAKSCGKGASLVTNGFWAVTPSAARAAVEELWRAGLRTLTVSYDDFHRQFTTIDRIKNALEASRYTPMHFALNIAVTPSHPGDTIIQQLGQSALNIPITKFAALPVGAALDMPSSEFPPLYSEEDALLCPEISPVYHFDGNVYPCCSPVITDTCLALGLSSDMQVSAALDAMISNSLLFVLRRTGLSWVLSQARAAGFDIPCDGWTSPCHACLALFRHPEILRDLRDVILAKSAQLRKISAKAV
jgi:hypothetical protein